jgi:hypothetical protein
VRELLAHSAGIIRDGVDSTYWAHNRPSVLQKSASPEPLP